MGPARCRAPALAALFALLALAAAGAGAGAAAFPITPGAFEVPAGISHPSDLPGMSEVAAAQSMRAMPKTRPRSKARSRPAPQTGPDRGHTGTGFQQMADACTALECKGSGNSKCPPPPAGFDPNNEMCDQFKRIIARAQKGTQTTKSTQSTPIPQSPPSPQTPKPPKPPQSPLSPQAQLSPLSQQFLQSQQPPESPDKMDNEEANSGETIVDGPIPDPGDANASEGRDLTDAETLKPILRKLIDLVLDSVLGPAPTDSS